MNNEDLKIINGIIYHSPEIKSKAQKIKRLEAKSKSLEKSLELAEQKLEKYEHLKDSTSAKERLVYLNAQLDVESIKHELASTNLLISVSQYRLDEQVKSLLESLNPTNIPITESDAKEKQ